MFLKCKITINVRKRRLRTISQLVKFVRLGFSHFVDSKGLQVCRYIISGKQT